MASPSYVKLKDILADSSTIAVIGASPNPIRPSNWISQFLMKRGYKVFPVNPGHDELYGLKCYPSLSDIEEQVDVVNIFRRSNAVPSIIDAAIERGDIKLIWMQDNVYHPVAAKLAQKNGIPTIMDDCIYRFLNRAGVD